MLQNISSSAKTCSDATREEVASRPEGRPPNTVFGSNPRLSVYERALVRAEGPEAERIAHGFTAVARYDAHHPEARKKLAHPVES